MSAACCSRLQFMRRDTSRPWLAAAAGSSGLNWGLSAQKYSPRYPKVPSAARELAVLSAGPAAGIAAGAAAALLGFWRFAEINWFLSGFNLLPLPGLDGGSILSLVLCALFGERGERGGRHRGPARFGAACRRAASALFHARCHLKSTTPAIIMAIPRYLVQSKETRSAPSSPKASISAATRS